jgi:hypothetical protein
MLTVGRAAFVSPHVSERAMSGLGAPPYLSMGIVIIDPHANASPYVLNQQ